MTEGRSVDWGFVVRGWRDLARNLPLTVVDVQWQDLIDQPRRTFRHAPAIARRAQSANLATERDEHLVAARRADDACEASLGESTIEVATKPALDVAR